MTRAEFLTCVTAATLSLSTWAGLSAQQIEDSGPTGKPPAVQDQQLKGESSADERSIDAGNDIDEGIVDESNEAADSANQKPSSVSESGRTASAGIDDRELVAILLLHHRKQREINRFAMERAGDERVRHFARSAAEDHDLFAGQLRAAENATDEEPRLGQVLRDIASNLRQRQAAPILGRRIVLGFRGTSDDVDPRAGRVEGDDDSSEDRDQPASAADAGSETSTEQGREAVREQREDVVEARRKDAGRDTIRKERTEVRDTRGDLRDARQAARQDNRAERRENVRRVVGEVLPVLRDNLPRILELVGKAVEEHSPRSAPRVALGERFMERHVESLKQELGRHSGPRRDHQYLHLVVLSELELVDALRTMRPHASDDLGSQLDQDLKLAEGRLRDARGLLDQIDGRRELE